MTAAAVVVAAGVLGLLGTLAAAVLKRRSDSEALGLETLKLALDTQGEQLERQGHRIDQLVDEVTACHRERNEDRKVYRAELAALRAQMMGGPGD